MELIQTLPGLRRPAFRKEYLGLLCSALSFLVFPGLIRWVDDTAAAIDPGALSAILLAVCAVLVFKAVTWWLIKSIWPAFALYSRDQFARDFRSLTAIQKTLVYLGFYLALLYAFVEVLSHLI